MRHFKSLKLSVAMLVAVGVGRAAAANAKCDATCSFIKHALASRSSQFNNLKKGAERKGMDGGPLWDVKDVPAAFKWCNITRDPTEPQVLVLDCVGADHPYEVAKQAFADGLSVLRKAQPRWKWFQQTTWKDPSISLYGGSKGAYSVETHLLALDTAKSYASITMFSSPTKAASASLVPYSP